MMRPQELNLTLGDYETPVQPYTKAHLLAPALAISRNQARLKDIERGDGIRG